MRVREIGLGMRNMEQGTMGMGMRAGEIEMAGWGMWALWGHVWVIWG
jgi:hypothetical protein